MAIKGLKDLFGSDRQNTVEEEVEYEKDEAFEEEEEEVSEEKESDNLEIRVVRPKRFEEATEIANYLLNGCLVFLNLESTDKTTSRRLLDYLMGTTYVLQGELQPVSSTAFIISPSGVDISGAIAADTPAAKAEPAHKAPAASEGFGDL